MTGHESGSRAPADSQSPLTTPIAGGDSTIKATPPDAASERQRIVEIAETWDGGRIALVVAGIGLLGAALGAVWFGLAEWYGLNPGGFVGMALVLVAVALVVVGLLLVVGGLGYYVLAPGFMGRRMAWYGVGSHRLVIATTILIVLVANAGPVAYTAFAGARGLC